MTTAKTLAGKAIPAYAKTAGRAVHVKIYPQPQDVAESREVLRVLQRFGEVIMYKHLKHEPNLYARNTALAIYQNTNAAQDAINSSPLRFELNKDVAKSSEPEYRGLNSIPAAERWEEDSPVDREQSYSGRSEDNTEWFESLTTEEGVMRKPAAGSTATSHTAFSETSQDSDTQYPQATFIPTSSPAIAEPFTSNPTPSSSTSTSLPYPPSPSSDPNSPSSYTEEGSKEFNLTITRSVLNHQAYIQRQHYYGGFHLDKLNAMAEDLEPRVPVKGMIDCQLTKGEAPLRLRLKRRENQEKDGIAKKSLRELWEQGRREREESIIRDRSAGTVD